MRSRTVVLVLVLLVAPAMLTAATHGIRHVIHVSGRVLDNRGLPVPEATVTVQAPEAVAQENPEQPCSLQLQAQVQTDEYGDYTVCWHSHGIPRNAEATVSVENQTITVPMESEMRWGTGNVQLDQRVPEASDPPADWNASWTVRGRMWRDSSLEDVPVDVTLVADDGQTVTDNTTSGTRPVPEHLSHLPRPYGVIELRVSHPAGFAVSEVRIDAVEATLTAPTEQPHYQLTAQGFEMPDPPFDFSTLILPLGLVGAGAAAVGGYFGYQKWQEKRELERARERSGRKRSN